MARVSGITDTLSISKASPLPLAAPQASTHTARAGWTFCVSQKRSWYCSFFFHIVKRVCHGKILYTDIRKLVFICMCFTPLQSGPKRPGGQQSLSSSMHSHSNRSGASCCLQDTQIISVIKLKQEPGN